MDRETEYMLLGGNNQLSIVNALWFLAQAVWHDTHNSILHGGAMHE